MEKTNEKDYIIFTDTDTDILPAEAEYYGYKLISMPYRIGEVETYPYVDFTEFDYHAFYDKLRSGVLPQTSALSPQNYIDYFEPYFAQGKDVLYVHFSAAMSGTFNAMRLAQEQLKEKYPDRTLYTVDTKGITLGSLNIVKEIGEMYRNGASIAQIIAWAKVEVDKFAIYFYADDLKFFGKSGRVSKLAAVAGGILGIKPIIYMGSDGKMTSISKAVGKKKALGKLKDYVVELAEDIKEHRVLIGHSDALPLAQEFAEMLKAEFGDDLNIEYAVVNPTAGSHCGPNCIGVSFHAKHR